MKKIKHLLLIFTLLTVFFAFCSCKLFKKDKNEGSTDNGTPSTDVVENLIYDRNTSVSLIFTNNDVPDIVMADIYNKLFAFTNNPKLHIGEIPEKNEHEIIIGKCDREISKRAYEVLYRQDYDELGDVGYVFYSDGSSIAMAYTESLTYDFVEAALYEFTEQYFTDKLILAPGTITSQKLNLMEGFEADDKARQDAQWAKVEAAGGAEVAEAMKKLYNLYTPDIISWFANLYEERVCVCTTLDENGNVVCQHPTDENGNPLCQYGGFYYSNSARNTVGYAPDIESTNQALSFLESSGMLSTLGGNYGTAIPDWMKNEIVAFVKGLQDPNGYFYHPQWPRELHHSNSERMGRDLSWATSILKKLGAQPYYTTPGGALQGTGKPSEASLTGKLNSSSVSAVSKIVAVASLNEHLKSPEAFRAYLDGLKITTSSYSAGSIVGAQTTTIKALDRERAGITSGTNFDYRNNGVLSKVLFDWLDENQNPENGLWDADSDYQACDGLFKIVNIYNDYKLPVKYALEASLATIAAISSDEPVYTVCNMYNAWANIGLIKKNLRECTADKAAAEETIAAINAAILEVAPEAIEITAQKTANFAITDGSFSYLIGHSSETSTGMPTAVVNSYEGDVNATLICTGGLIGHINNALELPKVNPWGLADWYVFVDIVESNNSSLKDESLAGQAYTFESDDVGDTPSRVTVNVTSEGKIAVAKDPGDASNNVLQINHPYAPGKGDNAKFTNYFNNLGRTCSVFESDFYVASADTDSTYVAQFTLGSAYYFTFRIADGKLGIWEDTTTELAKSKARHLCDVALDDWFNIRVEYYSGNHDSVRIKFYVDGKLIAVSANYGDYTGKNVVNESGSPRKGIESVLINPLSYVNINMYMDNVVVTSLLKEYVSEAETEGLVINADMPSTDRVLHNFDDNTLPEEIEITSGGTNVTLDGGKLLLSSDSSTTKLTIQRNLREAIPNSYVFGFDLDLTSAKDGEVLSFAFTEPYAYENKITDITKHAIKCITENGEKYLVVTSKSGAVTYETSKIAISDAPISFKFVYYTKQAQTLIYINDEFIGLSDYAIPSNPHIYELGYITLTYTGKLTGSLDNIFVESVRGSFDEDTTPDVDRILYDFEDGIGEGLTTSGEIADGALRLDGGKELYIPINKRVAPIVSYELSFDLKLDALKNEYTRICLVDSVGDPVFVLDAEFDGVHLMLYEVTRQGRLTTPIATYECTGEGAIKVCYYPSSSIVTFKIGDVYILASGIFYSETTREVCGATISSSGATLDNLYFDGLLFTYIAPTIVGSNRDDVADVITYENSSTGRLPSRVTTVLAAAGAKSAIELMMRGDKLTKVMSLTTAPGGNDYIDFALTSGIKATRLVFETDLYVDLTSSGYFEIHILKGTSSSNSAYRAILRNSGGNLYFYDTSGSSNQTPGTEKIIGKTNQWIKFKIEMDLGDGTPGTALIRTYVDNALVYESTNFYGAYRNEVPTLTDINRVRFYTWSATEGSFYFDNTSIKEASCLHTRFEAGEIITPPTCTEVGERELVCSDPECGYTVTEAIPSTGHTMGEWIKNEELGIERRDCENCDHYEEKELPPPVVNPDKTTDGDFIDGSAWTEIGGN